MIKIKWKDTANLLNKPVLCESCNSLFRVFNVAHQSYLNVNEIINRNKIYDLYCIHCDSNKPLVTSFNSVVFIKDNEVVELDMELIEKYLKDTYGKVKPTKKHVKLTLESIEYFKSNSNYFEFLSTYDEFYKNSPYKKNYFLDKIKKEKDDLL